MRRWPLAKTMALGGVLMGYGARIAFGCNVGAFFSGIASGSLHDWLWFLAALAGVEEAVVVPEEGVAYLKVDSRELDSARLQAFSA
mgnify:CR=1 FL=1